MIVLAREFHTRLTNGKIICRITQAVEGVGFESRKTGNRAGVRIPDPAFNQYHRE